MAIAFTSASGNLFNALGRIFGAANTRIGADGITAPSSAALWGSSGPLISCLETSIGNLLTQFSANTNLKPYVNSLYTQRDNLRNVSGSYYTYFQSLCDLVLLAVVNADVTLTPGTNNRAGAMAEVISQMKSQSYYVAGPTVSASVGALVTPTTSGADGVCIASVKGPDGVNRSHVFAEVVDLICTADSQPGGGGTLGREGFSVSGDNAAASVYGYDWPKGSGVNALALPTALDSNSTVTNMLTDGDFEVWSGSPLALTNWPIAVGVYGTDVVKEASVVFKNSFSANFAGDGATLSSIYQNIGSNALLRPSTVYAVNCWMRKTAGATGNVSVDLWTGSAVINDDASTANEVTKDVSTLSSSAWTAVNGYFRTPSILPSTIRLRVNLTTAVNAAHSLYVDSLCLYPAAQVYPGGGYVAAFSGSVKFIRGDKFPVTLANNWTPAASWPFNFERFFGMRALGQQLPISGSNLIAVTGGPDIA